MVSLGQSGNGTWPEGIKVEEYFIESSRSLVQRCTHRFLEPISTHLSIYLPSSYHLPIICLPIYVSALMAQWVKNLPAIQETQAWSLGQEDPLQEEMTTDSSTLAWEIPRAEELGGLQSMGSQNAEHSWETEHTHYLCIYPSVCHPCICIFRTPSIIHIVSSLKEVPPFEKDPQPLNTSSSAFMLSHLPSPFPEDEWEVRCQSPKAPPGTDQVVALEKLVVCCPLHLLKATASGPIKGFLGCATNPGVDGVVGGDVGTTSLPWVFIVATCWVCGVTVVPCSPVPVFGSLDDGVREGEKGRGGELPDAAPRRWLTPSGRVRATETSSVPRATVDWLCAVPGSWKGLQRLMAPHPALGRPSFPAGCISGRFREMLAGPCSAVTLWPEISGGSHRVACPQVSPLCSRCDAIRACSFFRVCSFCSRVCISPFPKCESKYPTDVSLVLAIHPFGRSTLFLQPRTVKINIHIQHC